MADPQDVNPYAPPQTTDCGNSAAAQMPRAPWKVIARRWEMLRLPYNGLVGFVGALVVLANWSVVGPAVVIEIIGYGIAANILYLVGPATEILLSTWVEAGAGAFIPAPLVRLFRSRAPTAVMFLAGTAFSVALTAAVGFGF